MAPDVNVAIIGAGPAGIASGIFLQRAGLRPLLLEKGQVGGLLRSANLVENYPGFPNGIIGRALAGRFTLQMAGVGLKVTRARVEHVTRLRGSFSIETRAEKFTSAALIVASGTRPAGIRLPGAKTLIGTKVFDEITEIPRTMREGKRAVVIGGGDAAFDYAINLTESGSEVTVLSRSDPRCLPLLRERAERLGVKVRIGCEIMSVSSHGAGVVCSARGSTKRLNADFILMACGRMPNTEFLDPALRKSMGRRPPPETAVTGLFLAGDVARGDHRQTGIAVGDGIRAAMMVQGLLRKAGVRA